MTHDVYKAYISFTCGVKKPLTCTDDVILTPNHLIYQRNTNENYFNNNVTTDMDNNNVRSSFAYMKLVLQNIFNQFQNVSLNLKNFIFIITNVATIQQISLMI